MKTRFASRKPPQHVPAPAEVLRFAEGMFKTVKKRRREQLAAGLISQERCDADTIAAKTLLRLAQREVIASSPLN